MVPHILIVDDDALFSELAGLRLELDGYHVTVAHDGRWGVALALALAPDLILLDLDLPEADGLAVGRELRARGVSAPIVLSSAAEPAVLDRVAHEIGCSSYLPKPFAPKALEETVRLVLACPGGPVAAPGRLS
jgi:DNA-binding response OmpR family regulator